jgi:hypothetical protein
LVRVGAAIVRRSALRMPQQLGGPKRDSAYVGGGLAPLHLRG